MKLIDFEGTGLEADSRNRPLEETARVEIQIYIHVPASDLRKMSGPGRRMCAIDVVREKLADADNVGDVLRRVAKYSDGAVLRVSGR